MALFRLAQSLGMRADFVMGHSVGEVAAAHVAGVLSLEDACTLVAARGQLMAALPAGGAMAGVAAGEAEVAQSLAAFGGRLSVAAVNGPRSVVISGQGAALEQWAAGWDGGKVSRLRVSHAFHSALMEPMLDKFAGVVQGLRFAAPRLGVVSNVTGQVVSAELGSPGYWVEHARRPVRFMEGIRALRAQGVSRFLELGPGGVLAALGRECAEEEGTVFTAALRARLPEAEAFARFLGEAHIAGAQIDWAAFYAGRGAQRVELPTYAFQRERYWLSPDTGLGGPAGGAADTGHPVLSGAMRVGDRDEWVFTGRLSAREQPWVADHVLLGNIVVPGTAFVDLVLAAGGHVGAPEAEELVLQSPLILPDGAAVQMQVTVGAAGDDGRREVAVYSSAETSPDPDGGDGGEAVCHARGTLAAQGRAAGWPGRGMAARRGGAGGCSGAVHGAGGGRV